MALYRFPYIGCDKCIKNTYYPINYSNIAYSIVVVFYQVIPIFAKHFRSNFQRNTCHIRFGACTAACLLAARRQGDSKYPTGPLTAILLRRDAVPNDAKQKRVSVGKSSWAGDTPAFAVKDTIL